MKAWRGVTCAAIVCSLLLLGGVVASTAEEGEGNAKGVPGGPLETTREILTASNKIVVGGGDRNQKLAQLKDLLRRFLDTDALARQAMGKHLDGRPPAQVDQFLQIFRDLFVRTYVQRLLLFDAPDFAYNGETITGDQATVSTEIVTPKDRFAVDYHLRKTAKGWLATDVLVEDVSLAENFRAQFDKALAKDSFEGLLDRLRKKLEAKPSADDF
jgi:phospholipid transport system substrate-binding protein